MRQITNPLSLLMIVLMFVSSFVYSQDLKTLTDEEFRLITQIYTYDKKTPVPVTVLAKEELELCNREFIVFEGNNNEKVPAYIGIPKTGEAPFPCVFLVPGSSGSMNESWDANGNFRLHNDEFLKKGIAVITVEVQYQGLRTSGNNFRNVGSSLFDNLEPCKYRDVFFQTVKDFRIMMDYLETRDDIDATKIGITGGSGGGIMSYIVAAVDSRIKACAPMSTPVNPYLDTTKSPKFVRFQMCELVRPWYYVNGLKNTAFLSVDGDHDIFSSKEEKMALINLVHSRDKSIKLYKSGHRLPDEAAVFVADWFAKRL